jgi:eukaryotic-like serine/threonine-protein kinase
MVGATLDGAYHITRLIAEGGMSAVYEATQLRLNQRVAVKVMARELASNSEALARFRREAEVTSRLRHPHLVTVMDFGTAPAGQPYLVMEYLEGIDLDQRIRRFGRLPLPTVVSITRQAASALAAAHDQGIVHRDLKPANLFLVELPGEPDFVKILDFGISKVRAASTQLTKAKSIMGTPNYMSPEQATGMLDDIDHRTDQWALACMVWEMLSGRAAFASDDMSAVFYQVIHLDPRPLRKRAPEVPASVETVLRRALSKNMAERFPSVMDFANELGRAAFDPWGATVAAVGGQPAEPPQRPNPTVVVDRRQGRRERRRRETSHPLATVNAKRIYAAAGVVAGLALALLVVLRGNHPAKAAAPPAPASAPVAMSAAAAKPVVAVAPPVVPMTASAPSPRPLADDTAARPTGRPTKPKAKAGRLADAADPFAPTPAKSKPAAQKPRKVDADFVDPFAP